MRACLRIAALVAGFWGFTGWATTLELSPSVAEEILSKTTTLVLNPPDLDTDEFQLEWVGKAPEGVEFSLVPDSLQWVRASEVLVLPRGRVSVRIQNAFQGKIEHAGYTQSLVPVEKGLEGEIAVALLSGEPHSIRLEFVRGTEKVTGVLRVKHSAHANRKQRVFIDSSCSNYFVSAADLELDDHTWAYVGCRMVYTKRESRLTPSFDVLVYWHGVGQTAVVNDVETKAASASIWALRLRSAPGRVRFQSGPRKMTVTYQIPEKLHLGSIGLGVGPYTYQFLADGDPARYQSPKVAPVATLYGSWFFTEYMRLVVFSALPIHSIPFSDTGIFLLLEQTRFFDNRVSMNLLLGGHGVAFPYLAETKFRFSFPQGIELIGYDMPFRRHRITLGGFLYPRIDGRLYNNVWIRWSYGRFFGEFNYISWEESVPAGRVAAQVAGVSFGFPLIQIF